MKDTESESLCDSCRKMAECFIKGIFERDECIDYDSMSLDELAEQDEFLRAIFVGDCPVCHSENTTHCDTPLEQVRNITIGNCFDCGAYWCTECGFVFKSAQSDRKCPHINICAKCSEENGYLDYVEFLQKFCPTCENYSNGCRLDPDQACHIEGQYVCPFKSDILDCPTIEEFLEEQV